MSNRFDARRFAALHACYLPRPGRAFPCRDGCLSRVAFHIRILSQAFTTPQFRGKIKPAFPPVSDGLSSRKVQLIREVLRVPVTLRYPLGQYQ